MKTKEYNLKPELIDYLQQKGKERFDSKTNHCVQFTNQCWRIYYGFPYCEAYDSMSLIEETGYDNPLDVFDSVLERSQKPQEGHLVAIKLSSDTQLGGLVTGFCVGDLSIFMNTKGLRYIPTKLVDYSWKNRNDNI